ncbi:MAG: hypothetical protein M3401_12860, partial [Actinomycetota bacterium]|nr:hypothetical protein [Actinomycetota bacterium]
TGPLRRPACTLAALWAAGLGAGATRATPSRSVRDIGGVTLALATMQLAWGAGFLWGCVRGGPPLRGLRRLASRS